MIRAEVAFARYRSILTGAASAFLARGLAVAASLLAVTWALPNLGPERFGLLTTIATVQVWLQMADLGLPAGIHNRLSTSLAEQDDSRTRRLIWGTVSVILLVGVALFVLSILLTTTGIAQRQFAVQSELARAEFGPSLLVGAGLSLLAAPAAVIAKTLTLQHRGYVANLWLASGQLLAIVALYAAHRFGWGLMITCATTIGAVTLASLGSVLWFAMKNPNFRPTPPLHRPGIERGVWTVSGAYSALQLAAMMLMNSPLVIVSMTISPEAAASYSVAARMTAVCTLVAQLASPYFWAAYSDAIVRDERSWLRRAFKRHVLVSVGSTAFFVAVLAIAGANIVDRWTHGRIELDATLLTWLLVWQCIVAAMNPAGALLNAFEAYRLQTLTSLLAGAVAVVLGFALAPTLGPWAVVACTSVAYLAFVAVPVTIRVKQLLNAP